MNAASQFFLHSEVGHFLLYLAASAAIGAMDAPDDKSGRFYRWAFKFLNTFAANFTRAFSSKVGLPKDDKQEPKP